MGANESDVAFRFRTSEALSGTPILFCHDILCPVQYIIPILDAGCGPGSIAIDFARRVPYGYVTGVEYVPDPLEQARSLASGEVRDLRSI
jgi:SAM-dependent methyltransferase